ncbi:MAG: hypothetical protein C4343_07675 [Chloroflexota bacterium]
MVRRSGCLAVLLIVALGATILSVLLPSVATGLVTLGLEAAGLRADRLNVSVEADPPFRLLLARADRVVIEATGVRWETTSAGLLSLVLYGVDLVARRAETIDGQLTDVRVTNSPAGPVAIASVTISGSGNGPQARALVAPAEAARVVRALAGSVGLAGARIALEPLDRVLVTVAGLRVEARVVVTGGAVVVTATGLPNLVVLRAGSVGGLQIRSVGVAADGGFVIEGRLDPAIFGLAP